MNSLGLRALLGLGLLAAVADGAPAGAPPAPNPVVVSVLVPDLERFLGHLEAAGRVISPGTVMPGGLKEMLGAQFGDPGLAGFGPGPVLGVTLQAAGGPPGFALFLPVRGPAPYAAAFAKQGWKTRVEGGLLVAAATQDALEAAWSVQANYRAIAKAPPLAHDLRLELQAERLVATYGPFMEMGFKSMMAARAAAPPKAGIAPTPAPTVNPATAQRFAALELKALLAVLSSTENLRWDLDIEAAAVSASATLNLKAGSPLAILATMPVKGPNPARALIPDNGLVNAEWRVDPKKVSDFASQLLDEMAKDKDTAELAPAEMKVLAEELPRCSAGQLAYSLRTTAQGGPVVDTAMTVSDETACLAMAEKGLSLTMDPSGFVKKFYQDLGLSLSMRLDKAVRTHSGVAVHRVKTTLKSSPPAALVSQAPGSGKASPRPAESPLARSGLTSPMLASMLRDTEFAYTHGYYVASQDPARLDALIDLAASGPPAVAGGPELLPGANMVASYDFAGLMKMMASSLRDPKGAASVFADLPPSEPVQFAMSLSEGRLDGRWRMPLAPLAALAEGARKAAAASPRPTPRPSPKNP